MNHFLWACLETRLSTSIGKRLQEQWWIWINLMNCVQAQAENTVQCSDALVLRTNKFAWSEDIPTGQLALSEAIHIIHYDRNYHYKQMNIYKLGHGGIVTKLKRMGLETLWRGTDFPERKIWIGYRHFQKKWTLKRFYVYNSLNFQCFSTFRRNHAF